MPTLSQGFADALFGTVGRDPSDLAPELYEDIVIRQDGALYEEGRFDGFGFDLGIRADASMAEPDNVYKHVQLLRLTQIAPIGIQRAQEGVNLVDLHRDLLYGLWQNKVHPVTLVANDPNRHGVMFCVGVQANAETPEAARQRALEGIATLETQYRGTYAQTTLKGLTPAEAEWLLVRMRSWSNVAVFRGIPQPRREASPALSATLAGVTEESTIAQQIEQFCRAMVDKEYIFMILASPLSSLSIERLLKKVARQLEVVEPDIEVTRSQTAGVSLPFMFVGNTGGNEGVSQGLSAGVSHAVGTGSSIGHTTTVGQSATTTHGTSTSAGTGLTHSAGTSKGTTDSVALSRGQSTGLSHSLTHSAGLSRSKGATEGISRSSGTSQGQTTSSGTSTSVTNSTGSSESVSQSHGTSTSVTNTQGTSQSLGQSQGVSQGVTQSQGTSQGLSNSAGVSTGSTTGSSISTSVGHSTSVGASNSVSHSLGASEGSTNSIGVTSGQTVGASHGTTQSLSNGDTTGGSNTYSLSHQASVGTGAKQGVSASTGVSRNVGGSASQGLNAGASADPGGVGVSGSHTSGTSQSAGASATSGAGSDHGVSSTTSAGSGLSAGSSQSASQTATESQGASTGTSAGASTGSSAGLSHSVGASQGVSNTSGSSVSVGTSVGASQGLSTGSSIGHSASTSVSQGASQGVGSSQGVSQSVTATDGTSQSTAIGQSTSQSTSLTQGTSQSTAIGQSTSQGVANSTGSSQSVGASQGASQGLSTSTGVASGVSTSTGATQGVANTQGVSQGVNTGVAASSTQGVGTSQSSSFGTSESQGVSTQQSQSVTDGTNSGTQSGTSLGSSWGMAGSMGIAPMLSLSLSKTIYDEYKRVLATTLTTQRNRMMTARQEGLFQEFAYLLTPDRTTKEAGVATGMSAFWGPSEKGELAVRFHALNDLPNDEERHLLDHVRTFSACRVKEPSMEGLEAAAYSTVLTSSELAVLVHPPRIDLPGIQAMLERVPAFRISNEQDGPIHIGRQIFAETATISNFGFGLRPEQLAHILVAGETRTGKTVTSEQLFASYVNLPPRLVRVVEPDAPAGHVTEELRHYGGLVLDWKKTWRGMLHHVERERFRFVSLWDPALGFKYNLLRIPNGMSPDLHMNMLADALSLAMGLGQRGKGIIREGISHLYVKKQLPLRLIDPGAPPELTSNVITHPRLSAFVGMADLYETIVTSMEDESNNRSLGMNRRDGFQVVIMRLQQFAPGEQMARIYTRDIAEFELGDPLVRERFDAGEFAADGCLTMHDLLHPGEVVVMEGGPLDTVLKKALITSLVTSIFTWARLQGDNAFDPAKMIVLEEAHEVLVSGEDSDAQIGGGGATIWEQLWNEGASYGLRLAAIVQMPDHVPPSVLANSGTMICHRVSVEDAQDVVMAKLAKDPRVDHREYKRFLARIPRGWSVVRSAGAGTYADTDPLLVHSDMLDHPPLTDEMLKRYAIRPGKGIGA